MIYSNTIRSINDVPIQQNKRNRTDVICCIIGPLFAIIMIIMALVLMNKQNYYKANFPTDSDHIPCGYSKNEQYPMVYFPDISNPTQRICVSLCPSLSDKQLICRVNSLVSSCKLTNIYETQQNFQRLGGFCVPTDQSARNKLIQNTGLTQKWTLLNVLDIILYSLFISFGVGFIWWVLVGLIPGIMVYISSFLSVCVAVIISVLLLVHNVKGFQGKQIIKIIVAIIMIFIAVLFFILIFFYKRRMIIMQFFLKWSTQWAKSKCVFFFWICIYIVLSVMLIGLIYLQYLAFLSSNEPRPYKNDLYLKLQPNILWIILNIIEFLWGFQFLKDSFNFIISGSASQYYLSKQPNSFCFTCCRMLKYHIGSVIGGSLLNSFFNLINFLFQSFRCYPGGNCNNMASCCQNISNSFNWCLFNFVRTDVYSYINLTGIPYCNSCRSCQQVINHSNNKQYIGSQSVQFFYRICSYMSCVGIVFILCYFIQLSKINSINLQSLLIIMLLAYSILAYFIDYHANAAEGIHVTSLVERHFGNQKSNRINKNKIQELEEIIDKNVDDVVC